MNGGDSAAWVRVNLAERIPGFVRRVLVAGHVDAGLALAMKARGAAEVHGVSLGARNVSPHVEGFDSVLEFRPADPSLPFPAGYFDCVTFADAADCWEGFDDTLAAVVPLLSPNGYLLCAVGNRHYRLGTGRGTDLEDMSGRLTAAGLGLYSQHHACGQAESVEDAEAQEHGDSLTSHYLFVAVRPAYNPVLHARELLGGGRPGWAHEILALIPPQYLQDPQVLATVCVEQMACLLAEDTLLKGDGRLRRFDRVQALFYQATANAPLAHVAYQLQAEFWRRLGGHDMAARLLRSVLHVADDEETRAQLAMCGTPPPAVPAFETAPPHLPAEPPFRVLLVTHPRAHYGLDVIYDGLCAVLGDDNVVEFPRKPFLHGERSPEFEHYPCAFERRGEPLAFEHLIERLEEGAFDVILYGDLERDLEQPMARRVVKAGRDTPLFILDEQDDFIDFREEVMEYLGLASVAGYFKREMIAVADYGPNAFPCPFAYPGGRVLEDISGPRPLDFFWAARHRMFGLRRLYIERIEALLGRTFEDCYPQDEYARRLRQSRLGINIFGAGFDTVRYWELPAHGCMLFSERLPIHIPHNFKDGESAVFFDDAREMEERVTYYLAYPDETAAIARAGHEHLKRYHTGSARARQMLGWIQQAIRA